MKRTLVLLMLAGLFACRDKGDDENTPATRATAKDSAAAPRKAIFSEPEAIGVLRALSDAAIAMARPVPEISQNDAVLSYARVLIADHRGIAELIKAPSQENGMSNAIRAGGDSIARAFFAMQGGFNNTFIEEQIKAHQSALQVLDTAVIPSVRDSATRTLVEQIRPAYAAHLQRAMQILSVRRKEAAERGEAWVSGFTKPAGTTDDSGLLGRPAPGFQQPQQRPPETQPQPQPQPVQPPVQADTSPPPPTMSNM